MKYFLFALLIIARTASYGQQPSLPVTDSAPVEADGLQAGYRILSQQEKEVHQSDFSRYQVEVYVTNTSRQAKIIARREAFNLFGHGVSAQIALFHCANATGARFTSKEFFLQAGACMVEGQVEDKDASGKTVTTTRMVNIGFWIRPGETISTRGIVIVPLNEKPQFTVTLFPGPEQMPGSFYTGNGGAPAWNGGPGAPAGPTARTDFVHIKNAGDHTYLNCKNGVLGCTAIDCSWGGAQWDLIPVPGTNSFLIRNRWNQGFLNTDNGSLLLGDGNSPGARWAFEPSGNDNSWYIVNTGNNTLLLGQKWIIE